MNGEEGRVGWFPHSNVVHTAPVDQRIGPSSQPLGGAGFDPAFIPGLTAPTKPGPDPADAPADSEAPEDEVPATGKPSPTTPAPRRTAEDTAAEAEDAEVAETTEEAGAAVGTASPESSDSPESSESSEPAASAAADDPEDAPADADDASAEDPVFEASDRRARIVADRDGVRLSLDEESCEFHWDEIGAVETETPRFGKRFTITVHTPDRRWYPIEIEATARSRFKEWETQLDEVLDAYFQE
ncbi:hypothetical protein [Streptomyces sp. NPDC047000]|uniref:hypothetical protein n=1 Tax=Streptomyces sp. NPDC047000 TaxID=3155474 RepID=UPI0033C3F185